LYDGENGKITPHTASAFADAVVEVLTKPALMATLRHGAALAGSKYTIEAMVENYRAGVNQCLTRTGVISHVSTKHQAYREDEVDA
jgi:glycosyltransferase involved in cell wall biosynthesis